MKTRKPLPTFEMFDKEHEFALLKENHMRCDMIFNDDQYVSEGNDSKTDIVLDAIKNNNWEKPNPKSYKDALSKSKHKEMLTDYSTSELGNMKLFKLDGYDIGYALKKKDGKSNEIVAVFNNEPDVKGIGNELMKSAISNGGCYLDHFDGYLSNLYQSLGFVEYDRYEFDPQYDQDGAFRQKYGEADVIFRKHKNCR